MSASYHLNKGIIKDLKPTCIHILNNIVNKKVSCSFDFFLVSKILLNVLVIAVNDWTQNIKSKQCCLNRSSLPDFGSIKIVFVSIFIPKQKVYILDIAYLKEQKTSIIFEKLGDSNCPSIRKILLNSRPEGLVNTPCSISVALRCFLGRLFS